MGLTGEMLPGPDRPAGSAKDEPAASRRRPSDLPDLLARAIEAALGEEHES